MELFIFLVVWLAVGYVLGRLYLEYRIRTNAIRWLNDEDTFVSGMIFFIPPIGLVIFGFVGITYFFKSQVKRLNNRRPE